MACRHNLLGVGRAIGERLPTSRGPLLEFVGLVRAAGCVGRNFALAVTREWVCVGSKGSDTLVATSHLREGCPSVNSGLWAFSLVERRSGSKFASYSAWGTDGVSVLRGGWKVFAWHRLGHISWSLGVFFKNHLLEVLGMGWNQETAHSNIKQP